MRNADRETCCWPRGQRLGAADLARLASCGISALSVAQQPRIGLLISGDELVPPGTARQPGAIWESNGTLLETMFRALGQSVTQRRVVADQPDALRQALLDLSPGLRRGGEHRRRLRRRHRLDPTPGGGAGRCGLLETVPTPGAPLCLRQHR